MPHTVYILECMNNTYYTGYTTDLARRYREHQEGTIKCRYTRSFPPKRIAIFWIFDDKSMALREEVRIKKLTRVEKEALICYENSYQRKNSDINQK